MKIVSGKNLIIALSHYLWRRWQFYEFGSRIPKGAVAGANAVVTKDVSPLMIVGGLPAKMIDEVNFKTHDFYYAVGGNVCKTSQLFPV
jgi:hypothetical protein